MLNRKFLYSLVIWNLLSAIVAIAEKPPEEHHEGGAFQVYEESYQNVKKIKPLNFKGFGAYRTRLQKMCNYLDRDGQRAWLAERAKQLSRSREICTPCRALYVVLNSVCASKKKNISKSPIPTVGSDQEPQVPLSTPTTIVIMQDLKLEPQTELLDLISRISREMAEDSTAAEDNYKAIQNLLSELLNKHEKHPSELAYFEIFASYMRAPFEARGIGRKPHNTATDNIESHPIEQSSDWLNDKL